ncbi:MAG: hypothetical protein ACYC1D_06765 [Acidimicrobiales bacterium]
MDRREFGSLRHLAGRFVGSLVPVGPSRADEHWAREQLVPGEGALWRRMSGADRRHALGVARRTVAALGGQSGKAVVGREITAAALLHDVGKVEAGIGTFARVGVTVAAMAVGREQLAAWAAAEIVGNGQATWRQRVGLYLSHDRVGADLLSNAGSDPFTIAWAGEHHRPPERWSVDAHLGEVLKAADDD